MLESGTSWKPKVLVAATVIGAVVGLATGYLLSRNAEESGGEPPKVGTTDSIRIALAVIGVVRAIVALGDRD